jgi:hypothetical protein
VEVAFSKKVLVYHSRSINYYCKKIYSTGPAFVHLEQHYYADHSRGSTYQDCTLGVGLPINIMLGWKTISYTTAEVIMSENSFRAKVPGVWIALLYLHPMLSTRWSTYQYSTLRAGLPHKY